MLHAEETAHVEARRRLLALLVLVGGRPVCGGNGVVLVVVALAVIHRLPEARVQRAEHDVPVVRVARRLDERLVVEDQTLLLGLLVDGLGMAADPLDVGVEHSGIGAVGRALPHRALGPVFLRRGGAGRCKQARGQQAGYELLHEFPLIDCI